MKKFYSIVAIAAMGVVANAQMSSTVVMSEDFAFTGPVNGNNGWVKHSGTVGQIQSNAGLASLIAGNSEDINKAFNPYIFSAANNQVNYEITFTVPNTTGLGNGDYFAGLTSNAGANASNFYGALFIKKGAGSGFVLGVGARSNSTPEYMTTELPVGVPITITVSMTTSGAAYAAKIMYGGNEVANSSSGTGSPASVNGFFLRQGGTVTAGTGNINIDSIIVTTFGSSLATAEIQAANVATLVKNTSVYSNVTFGVKANDVKFYNMAGQVVKTASVRAEEALNVEDLKAGMYIVTGTVNGQPVSQKILKK